MHAADFAHAGERARVLVVDDDQAVTRSLSQALSGIDVDVHEAADPYLGLKAAHALCPALLIVDLDMGGMDGYEFIDRVSAIQNCEQAPIFLVTGTREVARHRILGKRVVLVLPKPFDVDTLTTAVKAVVRSYVETRAARDRNATVRT